MLPCNRPNREGMNQMSVKHLQGDPSADKAEKVVRKKWRRPELRKLPIAATAGVKAGGNEGTGGGKGDAGGVIS